MLLIVNYTKFKHSKYWKNYLGELKLLPLAINNYWNNIRVLFPYIYLLFKNILKEQLAKQSSNKFKKNIVHDPIIIILLTSILKTFNFDNILLHI